MPPFRIRYQSTLLDLPFGDFVVGRSSRCNLSISDELVSRKHAVFHVGAEGVSVEDLNSRNGVVVNTTPVQEPCRLTHMDRIFIGQEEFVLIDAAKVADSAKPDPYMLCDFCGTANGVARRHCCDCGRKLVSKAGATRADRGATSISQDLEFVEVTRTDETRDVVGGVAAKAIAMGRFEEAERMLLPSMDALLERAVREQPLNKSEQDDPSEILSNAIGNAVALAEGLRDPKWIDWVFRMHIATGRLMDAHSIEKLEQLVRTLEYQRGRYIRRYLEGVQERAPEYGREERFLIKRLNGLAEVILARGEVESDGVEDEARVVNGSRPPSMTTRRL